MKDFVKNLYDCDYTGEKEDEKDDESDDDEIDILINNDMAEALKRRKLKKRKKEMRRIREKISMKK